MLLATVVADKPAHVLDQTEWGHVESAKHLEGLHGDIQRGALRRADDDHAGEGDGLGQGQGCIARAWR